MKTKTYRYRQHDIKRTSCGTKWFVSYNSSYVSDVTEKTAELHDTIKQAKDYIDRAHNDY